MSDELSSIDTIADGLVKRTGAFVRTFWDWNEDHPYYLGVRARIDGVTHDVNIALSDLQLWLGQADDVCTVNIHDIEVEIPTRYLQLIPAQIHWLASDGTTPIPGSDTSV